MKGGICMVLVCRVRGSDICVQNRIPLPLPVTFSATGEFLLILFYPTPDFVGEKYDLCFVVFETTH